MALVLLALALGVVLWFWKGRDLVVARYPALMPLKLKLDAVYIKLFGASRTLLVARMTALAGYVLMAFDTVQPILDAVLGSGMVDLGTLVPSAPWLGPLVIVLGHVFSALRQTTSTSVDENKAQVVAEVAVQKAALSPVNQDVAVVCPAGCVAAPVVVAPVVTPVEGTPANA